MSTGSVIGYISFHTVSTWTGEEPTALALPISRPAPLAVGPQRRSSPANTKAASPGKLTANAFTRVREAKLMLLILPTYQPLPDGETNINCFSIEYQPGNEMAS